MQTLENSPLIQEVSKSHSSRTSLQYCVDRFLSACKSPNNSMLLAVAGRRVRLDPRDDSSCPNVVQVTFVEHTPQVILTEISGWHTHCGPVTNISCEANDQSIND